MTRGKEDVDELTDFFTTCGLFSPDTTHHCIVTGAVASVSVTVDDAQSTGMRLLQDMIDLEVREYKSPVSSKGKSLAARLEVDLKGENLSVYLLLLFQHLSVASSTKTDDVRQESFAYELRCMFIASIPLWLKTLPMQLSQEWACWRHMDASRFRTERKARSNVCPQRETDDISTEEAWVKTRQSIDRGLLLHHIP